MKKITIICPFLNEGDEPLKTVESIYATAPKELFQIIAIDDANLTYNPSIFSAYKEVEYIRNSQRLGSGASKHLGGELAKTPFICIIDSHMRFRNDHWMEKMIKCMEREPKTVWCTTCLGLDANNMNVNKPSGSYYGANLLMIDHKAPPDRPSREILEPKWAEKKDGLEYEIPCVLGANYFMTKTWFDFIRGMKGLKMWGSEEPFLSLKSFLAGGSCKVRTDVGIGHRFRQNAPYNTGISHLVYNKIFICKTIFPEKMGEALINHLPKDNNFRQAMAMIEKNKNLIEVDKEYYRGIFKRSVYDVCKQLKLELPLYCEEKS